MPQIEIRFFKQPNGKVPCKDWLAELKARDKKGYAKCLERIRRLSEESYMLGRPAAAPLRDGIHELRAKSGPTKQYRILYFFCGLNAAVLSHGFLKKEQKVRPEEINLAIKNKKLVDEDLGKHTAEFELE